MAVFYALKFEGKNSSLWWTRQSSGGDAFATWEPSFSSRALWGDGAIVDLKYAMDKWGGEIIKLEVKEMAQ